MGTQAVHQALAYYDAANQEGEICAIACLILACKFLVRDDNIPYVIDVIRWLRTKYTKMIQFTSDQVKRCEIEMLKLLKWSLHRPTVCSFLDLFGAQGFLLTSDTVSCYQKKEQTNTLVKVFRQPNKRTV